MIIGTFPVAFLCIKTITRLDPEVVPTAFLTHVLGELSIVWLPVGCTGEFKRRKLVHKSFNIHGYKLEMQWGHLTENVRGLIMYSLSPYEQKAFAGAWSHGVPNMIRRVRSQFFRVVPPLFLGYLIYDWSNREYERQLRKNPCDYACDE